MFSWNSIWIYELKKDHGFYTELWNLFSEKWFSVFNFIAYYGSPL